MLFGRKVVYSISVLYWIVYAEKIYVYVYYQNWQTNIEIIFYMPTSENAVNNSR